MIDLPIKFTVGGDVQAEDGTYLYRPADNELFEACRAGKFAYVLACRQIGKSSLKNAVAERLAIEGIRVARIDLNRIGQNSNEAEVWHFTLLDEIARNLQLKTDVEAWWESQPQRLSLTQRFLRFLEEVILTEISESVVIFIDEIDMTLGLSFTDDFFTAIRVVHNDRAQHLAFRRLTFVLLGVATPDELINDNNRTPFNIGHAIPMRDFTLAECEPLRQVIEAKYLSRGDFYFQQIYNWTNGHPYLTQKLCKLLIEHPAVDSNPVDVNKLVDQTFLKVVALERNIAFVQSRFLNNPYRAAMLRIYRQVLEGKEVNDDRKSIPINCLKLYGLIVVEKDRLKPRNKIYTEFFDEDWIKKNTPVNWQLRMTIVASVLAVLLIGNFYFTIYQQQQTRIQVYVDAFRNNTSADVRANSLVELNRLKEIEQSHELFLELPILEQAAILARLQDLGRHDLINNLFSQHKLEEQIKLLIEAYQAGSLGLVQNLFHQFELKQQIAVLAELLERFNNPSIRNLFFALPLQDQLAMFEYVDSNLITDNQLFIVVQALNSYLDNSPDGNQLLKTMAKALYQSARRYPVSTNLANGIGYWFQGRKYAAIGSTEAITTYNLAIEQTPQNFGAYFDLALAQINQKQYLSAYTNLKKAKDIAAETERQPVTNSTAVIIPQNSVQRFVDAQQIEGEVNRYIKQISEEIGLGRLVAPTIGLDAPVVVMGWKSVIENSPKFNQWEVPAYEAGWHINSKLPGQSGNIVISGHHNIKGEVFRYIVDLEISDMITFYVKDHPYEYEVIDKFILKDTGEPDAVRRENAKWIGPFPEERLTLVTSWPYSDNTHRVIIIAKPKS